MSIEKDWEARGLRVRLLMPLSWLFCLLVWIRRSLYRFGLLRSYRAPVPVVVVGNITVGGTGKTPLVVWLVGHLSNLGYRPGIVARGYRGSSSQWPLSVDASSDPRVAGDEPVLLARRTLCPVCVGPDRPAAVRQLLERDDCDIIVTDDGLQHYALRRDLEIAVVDGERRFGNELCLPAGPLREPLSRLRSVDMVVANGEAVSGEFPMRLSAVTAVNLQDSALSRSLEDFIGGPVHAVAGIGNPARFFATLRQLGLDVREHPFPDHHDFNYREIQFNDEYPVLMTEKDAVKCTRFAKLCHWYLKVDADFEADFSGRLTQLLQEVVNG
ncbi:MAG: tetraacyldisaccharide 4'-kinase [Gammaproteobacteria bacterium]|nr:tetraacyldisaccharide 4'-kinase [Gammaproteobacteria bacterium]